MLPWDNFYFTDICKITASFLFEKCSWFKTQFIVTFVKFSSVFSKWPFKMKDWWELLSIWASFLPLGPLGMEPITVLRGWVIAFCFVWRPASWNPHSWTARGNSTHPGSTHRATIHSYLWDSQVPSLRGNQLSSSQLCVDTTSLFWFPKRVPAPALTGGCDGLPAAPSPLGMSSQFIPSLTSLTVMSSLVGFLNC